MCDHEIDDKRVTFINKEYEARMTYVKYMVIFKVFQLHIIVNI